MFTHLILENFKAFATRQVIPLAPITLIFGPNSAGKSSLLHALLLLRQSLPRDDAPADTSTLIPRGEFVDLGGFRTFAHDPEQPVEIGVILPLTPRPVYPRTAAHRRHTLAAASILAGQTVRIRAGADQNDNDLHSIDFYWQDPHAPAFTLVPDSPDTAEPDEERLFSARRRPARVSAIEEDSPFWEYLLDIFESRRERGVEELSRAITSARHTGKLLAEELAPYEQEVARLSAYSVDRLREDVLRSPPRNNLIDRLFLFGRPRLPLPPPGLASRRDAKRSLITELDWTLGNTRPQLAAGAGEIGATLLQSLRDLQHLGPLRQYPTRVHVLGATASEALRTGARVPDLLYRDSRRRGAIVEQLNAALRQFGIRYTVDIAHLGDDTAGEIFALRVKDPDAGGRTLSLLDVGFGVSQVLPVIVESITARGRTLLIEQPELHLHPALQANLGKLFADCVGEDKANQFIIETHSEHLVLRIQTLVRRRKLRHDQVSILYVDPQDGGATCELIPLDADGDFTRDWPRGFFPERQQERLRRFEGLCEE